MRALLVAFEILRGLLRLMLLVLVQHFVRATLKVLLAPPSPSPPDPEVWPTVTVQLPMRNEFYVADRVIRIAAALDYPADRLEIQVLDDSDDETRARVARTCESLRADGVRVVLHSRSRPIGYKAGALQEGLERATGELVAIFDADCVPPANFLRLAVPHFRDPGVGLVQVRWSFLNRETSIFTRLQAILLEGLFAVDQRARSLMKAPFQFNGTNGVWRAACLREVGGWRGGMLAEDVDMSFRSFLRGWKLVHLTDWTVPTEIPETMSAFRTQQRRWARGSAQCLRSLFFPILRARIPWGAKLMMLMHLGRHAIDPLILMTCISTPFTTLYGMPFLVDYGAIGNAVLLGLVFLAVLLHYGAGLKLGRGSLEEIWLVPLVIPLAIGLSLVYTVAFVGGLASAGGEFVRTPKEGDEKDRAAGPVYRSPFDPLAILEAAFGAAHAYFAWSAFRAGYFPYAFFFATVAVGFGWVGIASLSLRRRR